MTQLEPLKSSEGRTLEPLAKIANTAMYKVQGQDRFFITKVEKGQDGKTFKPLQDLRGFEQLGKYFFDTEKEVREIFYKMAIPFELPKEPTPIDIQTAVENHLNNEKKIPKYDPRYGEYFADLYYDLHNTFIKKQI